MGCRSVVGDSRGQLGIADLWSEVGLFDTCLGWCARDAGALRARECFHRDVVGAGFWVLIRRQG